MWLKPVIGLIAAIAVGVGAAFVAVRFAPVTETDTSVASVEALVLQPIPDDAPFPEPGGGGATPSPEADPDLGSDADGGIPLETVSVVEISDPAFEPETAPAELPPGFEAALVEATELTNPYFAFIGLLSWLSSPFGDPCAIDRAASDCPSGVTATLLGGDLLPLAASIGGGTCATATGANLAVSVRTNAPAEITVTMRSGGLEQTRTTRTERDVVAEWLPGGATRVFWHCVSADGWDRGATVDVEAVVVDDFGRTFAVDRSLTVPVSASAVRPDAQLLGLSGNLVQVSVPFSARQDVRVGWVSADSSSCDFTAPGTFLGPPDVFTLRPQTISAITPEYTASNNWLPTYNQQATTVFTVAPGASYKACVGWFDEGRGDIAGRPQYRNEVVVHAPATSFPTLTLTDVRLDVDVPPNGVRIRAAVPGAQCGAWQGPEGALPQVICDLPAISSYFEANGYIVVTTDISTDSGAAINHHVIEASAVNCAGGCEARTETYRVPILSARPGRCGSDCRSQETLGWARMTASWPETLGREWWELGETVTGGYTEPAGEAPLMEIASARWTLSPRYDPSTATQGAWFPLTTDRPVTVSATLAGDCFRTPTAPVYRNDSLQQWSGGRIEFPELCMGTFYAATIVLTDEDGDVSTYAFARGDFRHWPWSTFQTQPLTLDLPLRVQVTAPAGEYWAFAGGQFSQMGSGRGTGVSTPGANVRRCFSDQGGTVGYRMDTITVFPGNRFELRLQVRQTEFESEGRASDGFRDCALLPGADYQSITITFFLTLDELLNNSLTTYTDPTTGIEVELRPEPTLLR